MLAAVTWTEWERSSVRHGADATGALWLLALPIVGLMVAAAQCEHSGGRQEKAVQKRPASRPAGFGGSPVTLRGVHARVLQTELAPARPVS